MPALLAQRLPKDQRMCFKRTRFISIAQEGAGEERSDRLRAGMNVLPFGLVLLIFRIILFLLC
ncbi:hypothetical protein TRIP_E160035 [uncultured Spirochaetota bacterium]|nr:hypothetical protein TRIP_E160035 [uncultured Spirochaetota bacterium]